jgi:hypothetical protein
MSEQATILTDLILSEPWRRPALEAVAALGFKDCWIGAGFLRARLWDLLHGYETPTPIADIDVVYFDPDDTDAEMELAYEQRLASSNAVLPGRKHTGRCAIRLGCIWKIAIRLTKILATPSCIGPKHQPPWQSG